MSIIGFNFTKILVEKTGSPKGKINISNNIGIVDVKNAKINLGESTNAGVRFAFAFSSEYDPKIGKISLEGEVIVMESKEVVDEILKSWKDKKAVPKDMMSAILNTVLNKCNIQALILSRDLNLPSPIPLPKVNVTTKPGKEEVGKKADK
jgi:hypothetical protein